MNPLDALRAVDFDWATRLDDVWSDVSWDVPELHGDIRDDFRRKIETMKQDTKGGSPLGWVLVGTGGAGKTHLLGAFRREAVRQTVAFVLVDMTDVRDFWESVLQGYLDSLQQILPGEIPLYQHQMILQNIIARLGPNRPVSEILRILAARRSTNLPGDIQKVLNALNHSHPVETRAYHNVVRALICMNSTDFGISNLGATWLQGQAIDEEARGRLGFTLEREQPRKIVEALSWFLSLSGPTVLAFDQLDPIVTQLYYRKLADASTEEQSVAESIILQIGGGLGALYDTTRNTLTLVSGIETTWETLRGASLRTFADRFEMPRTLQPVKDATVARAMVQGRLNAAYQGIGFTPEYPSWPFGPEAFEAVKLDSPREVLQRCERHRQSCLRNGRVTELTSFGEPTAPVEIEINPRATFDDLDRRFEREKTVPIAEKPGTANEEEERLAALLQAGLRFLLHERSLPPNVDGRIDVKFTGGKATRPLHARLRLIFQDENEREEHFCVRVLEQTNAMAYQARLKAAITQAGIDRSLKFRRLTVIRSHPLPGGKVTESLTQRFQNSGGVFYRPGDEELRIIRAVDTLKKSGDPDFESWLRDRQPISKLTLIRTIVPSPLFFTDLNGVVTEPVTPRVPEPAATISPPEPPASPQEIPPPAAPEPPNQPDVPTSSTSREDPLPLGRALVAGKPGKLVTMPVALLEKHTAILAGAGSGKTVLVRRIVEEAALMGIPSIVIDPANDLSTLDEPRPAPSPDGWLDDDPERAKRYHENTEVIVWTPGRESGNPLALEPLPDLSAFAGDSEEMDAAIAMLLESLLPTVAPSQSVANRSRGTLSSAIRYFAREGSGQLRDFIALLDDLPNDAGLGVAREAKLAQGMADALKGAVETNPLLRSSGPSLDPALLFGDVHSPKTRISVINLHGLGGLEPQRAFLNQLALTLFTWIKRHPDPSPRPLRGLLVIDEAKDFVPAQKASVCKESLIRLAAQARKYHLGLVLATQHPREIDNKIVANASTHFYGKASSPSAIECIKELIKGKGGTGDDVPRLPRGQFYVFNSDAGLNSPTKVQIPLCLSAHPENAPDEPTIVAKASASRARLAPA